MIKSVYQSIIQGLINKGVNTMNNLKYYEQIEQTKISLLVKREDLFSYASKTSIHSEVTDWAYGEVLERECIDISDGKPVSGKFDLESKDRRIFLKVIACMPDWEKFATPFSVKVNDKVVYEDDHTFFEQVNLGWPAFYIRLSNDVLCLGENTVTVKAGGNLYLSELSLVSYPEFEDLEQVSIRKYVKKGDKFAVAVCDKNNLFSGIEQVENCQFLGESRYKNLTILSFKALEQKKLKCTAKFGDKILVFDMPKVVENADDFVFGIDSDDHRHDDTDETAFIMETTILSDMGNFIQFRPQPNRNHYTLLSKENQEKLVGLISAFGMQYGLCDCSCVMEDLPDIVPENFYGYHIHEPYLVFNPALLDNPFECKKYLCEPEKIYGSQSFGESKDLYMDVLKRSKKAFSKDKGLTSFGAPSLLCIYEGEAGVDRITIEPVSNLNLLTGAVRTTSVKIWGAHIPTDWYFGVPVDKVKSNKFRLAMQYLYLNGASYLYAENSLFKTNAFERCDWESGFCVDNRKYQREFYEYAITHPRKGKLIVDKAIVYGRNEFFMWKLNDRIAELKEKDWDSNVWGKWDNAYQIAWNASEAWLPASEKQNVFESPLNKKLFSGTPYGNVDIVGAEKDFSSYSQLVFLGWNTMDDNLLEKLKSYVKNGGTLMISYAHFNYADRNDVEMIFPESQKIEDLLGVRINAIKTAESKVIFEDGKEFSVEEKLDIAVGDIITAKPICKDENGNGIVYENSFGKGKVYFVSFKDYVKKESDVKILSRLMEIIGTQGDIKCDNNNVSFTVRETEKEYIVSVLNMNCIEGFDEEFNIEFKGLTASGKVKVGEIKEFSFEK